ncbi:MAG: glutamine--fructose-6-phosphate transaminase (isomerizing) [Aquificaceae bacterium]|nr:glutamine--fructose-6-phosphate transaminase (isomerizing) [Aquificaceae bacterium]MDW8237008.1 glutamine--fructose-6-phosphate transaminase (isomerizing) [Aquificaceae bacterium]
MCGIVGYVGSGDTLLVLLEALEKLEYRGYDSSGVALIEDGKLFIEKKPGKIRELIKSLWGKKTSAKAGIGHTRWATHGQVCELNAHPHSDSKGEFAVVHNGIIENYRHLKEQLLAKGIEYRSQTDSEAIAHLIALNYKGDLLEATHKVTKMLEGAFAFAVLSTHEPERIVAFRRSSPLVVGLGEGENFLASDIPALLPFTRRVVPLSEGELVDLRPDGVSIYAEDLSPITREVMYVQWDVISAEKGGFKHFMLKEINEQPRVVSETIRGLISRESELPNLADFRRVIFVACGTSLHSAMIAKHWLSRFQKIPSEVYHASELRYSDEPISSQDLVIAISQSGETADTRFAALSAKERGATLLSIVNVVGSALDRESDFSLYTHAGPEIGVAATKTFIAQLSALYYLSTYNDQKLRQKLSLIPALIEEVLTLSERIKALSPELSSTKSALYIGRYLNYPIALEGALKLKEISYIHAEGLPAGEMKHGPIALIDEKTPVFAIAVQDRVYEKMLSNAEEVLARRGKLISVGFKGDEKLQSLSKYAIEIPKTDEYLTPFITIIPLQLLAYFIADHLGLDVDQPRNLAKTVTVE